MKDLRLVIIFLLVNVFLLAQKDISIACIPFTGDSIESEDEANFMLDILLPSLRIMAINL